MRSYHGYQEAALRCAQENSDGTRPGHHARCVLHTTATVPDASLRVLLSLDARHPSPVLTPNHPNSPPTKEYASLTGLRRKSGQGDLKQPLTFRTLLEGHSQHRLGVGSRKHAISENLEIAIPAQTRRRKRRREEPTPFGRCERGQRNLPAVPVTVTGAAAHGRTRNSCRGLQDREHHFAAFCRSKP